MKREFVKNIQIGPTVYKFYFVSKGESEHPAFIVTVIWEPKTAEIITFEMEKEEVGLDYIICPGQKIPALFYTLEREFTNAIKEYNNPPKIDKNASYKLIKELSVSTFIIAYLFFCGALYLASFWGTFDIELMSLVGVWDIPKSVIIPFTIAFGAYLLNIMTHYLTADSGDDAPFQIKGNSKGRRILRSFTHVDFILSISSLVAIYLCSRHQYEPIYWLLSAIVLSYLLPIKLKLLGSTKKLIPEFRIRRFFCFIIGALPLYSVAIGKVRGDSVYNNDGVRTIHIVDQNKTPQDSLLQKAKFIGFIGDFIVASSTNDSSLFFLNSNKYEVLELRTQPKEKK